MPAKVDRSSFFSKYAFVARRTPGKKTRVTLEKKTSPHAKPRISRSVLEADLATRLEAAFAVAVQEAKRTNKRP